MFDKAKAERRRVNRAIKKLNTKPVPNEPSDSRKCLTCDNRLLPDNPFTYCDDCWDKKYPKPCDCPNQKMHDPNVLHSVEPSAIGDELDALINDVAPVHLQDKMKTLIEQQTKQARIDELRTAYVVNESLSNRGGRQRFQAYLKKRAADIEAQERGK